MNRITTGAIVVLLIVTAVLAWTTDHYHGNAVKYKSQRDTATHNLKLANETIDDMQKRQRDVAAGRRRLYVNATCPAVVRKTTATPGVDDGTGPRLNPTAERNYYTLRKRIEKAHKQIDGLQSYIKSACQ